MTDGNGDRLILKDLGFFGYHGVLPEEAKLGQRFFIDLELGLGLSAAAASDDIATSVSYADVYAVVDQGFGARRFNLLEALGQYLVDQLFAAFPQIDWIVIRLRKPEAPIAMVHGYAGVELHRRRTGF